jgi:hypothetical protein
MEHLRAVRTGERGLLVKQLVHAERAPRIEPLPTARTRLLFRLGFVHVAQVTVQAVAALEGTRAHVTHVTWTASTICGSRRGLFSRHSRFLHPLTRMSSIVLSQIIERAKRFATFDAERRAYLVHLEMILAGSRSVGLFAAMRAAVGRLAGWPTDMQALDMVRQLVSVGKHNLAAVTAQTVRLRTIIFFHHSLTIDICGCCFARMGQRTMPC